MRCINEYIEAHAKDIKSYARYLPALEKGEKMINAFGGSLVIVTHENRHYPVVINSPRPGAIAVKGVLTWS